MTLTVGSVGCGDPCLDDGFGTPGEECAAVPSGSASDSGGEDASGTMVMTTLDSSGDATLGSADGSSSGGLEEFCRDADGDGFADPDDCVDADPNDPPSGRIPLGEPDCDDSDPDTFPGAAENDDPNACMNDDDGDGWGDSDPPPGVDPGNDCDDDDPTQGECDTLWCLDTDGDGFGDPDECIPGNMDDPPSGNHVPNGDDCVDSNPDIFPGAARNEPSLCTIDADDDGWGDANTTAIDADADDGTDCDDGSDFTFPGASANEAPPLDMECTRDEDGDDYGDEDPPAGVTSGTDCVDDNILIFPSAAANEIALCTIDADGDGYGDASATTIDAGADDGTDCDDTDLDTFPGASENEIAPLNMACTTDADDDGFGEGSPAPGVTPGSDCDDTDPMITSCSQWCLDADDDGFGDPGDCVLSDMQPSVDHVMNDMDCDDADVDTFPGSAPNDDPVACMTDADDDDWGDESPAPGVTPGTDCDDSSADTFVGSAPNDDPLACMRDVDGDDWGDDTPPAGVTPGTDCNDNAPFAFPGAAELDDPAACMEDADDDGFGDTTPPAGVTPGTDCDDTNPAVQICTQWCDDTDGDGFGDPSSCVVAMMQPPGTVGNDTDCDDSDIDTFPGSSPNDDPVACMTDVDDDDWGDDTPAAGVTPGTDCDDSNPDTFVGAAELENPAACMQDVDDDGFGDDSPPPGVVPGTDCDDTDSDTFVGSAPNDDPLACMTDDDDDDWGDESPAPGVTPGTDCNDTFEFAFPGAAEIEDPAACMEDEDDDGFGDAMPPAGVTPGTDCDDTDPMVLTCSEWCDDTDGDMFGDPSACVLSDMQPPGTVGNNADCDDTDINTFPGSAPNDDPLACMTDVDDDDWGDDNPAAGVDVGSDCDDSDVLTFPGAAPNDDPLACMTDVDGDDWGDDNPAAGVVPGTDCDDSDADTFVGAAPNDDPLACMSDADDDDFGDNSPPAGVTPGTDCDDANPAVTSCPQWCDDADVDGFGDPGSCVFAEMQPPGTVGNDTDCDDTDTDTFPGAAPNDDPLACMTDVDDDDWGDDNPGAGIVPGTDCDDSNANTFFGAAPNDDPLACMNDDDGDDWGDATPAAGVTPGVDCEDADLMVPPGCMSVVATATPFNILLGEMSDLLATPMLGDGNYTYIWGPAGSLDDPAIQGPVATPSESTTYDVVVTDGQGEMATDSVTVHVTDVPLDLDNCVEEDLGIDLSNPPAIWAYSMGNTQVCEVANGDPAALVCNVDLDNGMFEARFEVQQVNDNDQLGFVWGWQDAGHFYILTWKQDAQNFGSCGVDVPEGVVIKVVDAAPGTLQCEDLLDDADTPNSTVLALPADFFDQGWNDNEEYIFQLETTPTGFTPRIIRASDMVTLAEQTILDTTYTNGRFGVYTYSQENSCFWDVFTSGL